MSQDTKDLIADTATAILIGLALFAAIAKWWEVL